MPACALSNLDNVVLVTPRSWAASTSTVRQWEQGDKHPRGTSLKLLNLIADKGLEALS